MNKREESRAPCDAHSLQSRVRRLVLHGLLANWAEIAVDIGMPGEDGYSLIRKVRDLLPRKVGRTPALALTAYARTEDRVRALAAGYQMHVPKPIEPIELAAAVKSLATGLMSWSREE